MLDHRIPAAGLSECGFSAVLVVLAAVMAVYQTQCKFVVLYLRQSAQTSQTGGYFFTQAHEVTCINPLLF